MSIMPSIQIAGYNVPVFHDDPGWIPETNIVLTPTTNANLKKILPAMVQNRPLLLVGTTHPVSLMLVGALLRPRAVASTARSRSKHERILWQRGQGNLPERRKHTSFEVE